MLVLSRNAQVSVANKDLAELVIEIPPCDKPRTVVVTLVENRGDKSRLGVVAPDDITVMRREVWWKSRGKQPDIMPADPIAELYRDEGVVD